MLHAGQLVVVAQLGREAARALEHVERRVVPGGGEPAAEHEVAVEDRPGAVRDRLVHVVALDEDGVDAGDAAPFARSGAFEELGQDGERRRWIAPCGRRLAGGETDVALCHRHAGQRVHQQQDVFALVREVLGDAGRCGGSPSAHERRFV